MLRFTLIACLPILFTALPPVEARTQPNDVVRIVRMTKGAGDWSVEEKKFKDLSFDKKIMAKIQELDQKASANEYANKNSRFKLTHIRIWEDEVQILIFRNDFGDTEFYQIGQLGYECSLTLTGNGWSRCTQPK